MALPALSVTLSISRQLLDTFNISEDEKMVPFLRRKRHKDTAESQWHSKSQGSHSIYCWMAITVVGPEKSGAHTSTFKSPSTGPLIVALLPEELGEAPPRSLPFPFVITSSTCLARSRAFCTSSARNRRLDFGGKGFNRIELLLNDSLLRDSWNEFF